MTRSTEAGFAHRPDVIQRRYEAVAQDSRYGHYGRIPERICRCLDYFRISSDRPAVKERLHSYYLFIGVVDDLLDSCEIEVGTEILKQLKHRRPVFGGETPASHASLVTEVFKRHISPEVYPAILARLEELFHAVVAERNSNTMTAYIEQRKTIGRLTAEVSYLLIQPLLQPEHQDLPGFLRKVGEVGCLVDSAIDLRADGRLGLLSFKPTVPDYLELMTTLLRDGLRILLRHARLLGLFAEAVADNLLDFRFRRGRPPIPSMDPPPVASPIPAPALQPPTP